MDEYIIRKAVIEDIPFLADAVIAAEKGKSDKLSFATLFNVTQSKAKELIIKMLEEEIDGCELSVSSFLVVEYDGETVAALGSWIEGFNDSLPSKILKSNLIVNTFDKESIEFFRNQAHIVKSLVVEREPLTLQLEYLYISSKHTGKGLDGKLLDKIEENALIEYPSLKKVQGQLYKNNIFAIITVRKRGYDIVRSYKSSDPEVLNYIPFNEKLLMQKIISK